MAMTSAIEKPLDLVRLSLDEEVYVKCRGSRELRGKLHAFDEHMNLVLGNVVETTYVQERDPDTGEVHSEAKKRSMDMLYVRGDVVVLLRPPPRA